MDPVIGLGEVRLIIFTRVIIVTELRRYLSGQVKLPYEGGTGVEQTANGRIGGVVLSMIGGAVIKGMV